MEHGEIRRPRSDHNQPMLNTCPQLQPTAAELLNALAITINENEQLRGNMNNASAIYGRRDYSNDDLRRGAELKPQANFRDGTLIVKIDN